MSYDIEKALAYQIKKDIAQRYFRIRKLIEEDSAGATELVNELNKVFHQEMRPLFLRMYALLLDEDLLDQFATLLGLEELPFTEEFSELSEEERMELLRSLKPHGWFKERRFSNLVIDTYRELYDRWKGYHDLREEVLDELEFVRQEIEQFTKNYSLDEIMQFLRSLNTEDEAASKALGRTVEGRRLGAFDEKLSLGDGLDRLFEKVPRLDRLPAPGEVESGLEGLARQAFVRHKEEFSQIL